MTNFSKEEILAYKGISSLIETLKAETSRHHDRLSELDKEREKEDELYTECSNKVDVLKKTLETLWDLNSIDELKKAAKSEPEQNTKETPEEQPPLPTLEDALEEVVVDTIDILPDGTYADSEDNNQELSKEEQNEEWPDEPILPEGWSNE